jgi:GT2 family glycosyltransferase
VIVPAPNSPAVSIIVALHNCLHLTQAMLRSLDATWPAQITREVILVDDASSDGTGAWLAALPATQQRRVISLEHNAGYAVANNLGARSATGQRLLFLNNDLEFSPGWFEPLLRTHLSLGANAGVTGNVQRRWDSNAVDHAGIRFGPKGKPEHRTDLPFRRTGRFRVTESVTGACFMIDRDLWSRFGGFDERYRNGCEDIDLCLRIRERGLYVGVALDSCIRHHVSCSPGRRDHDEENTRRLFARWESTIATLALKRWSADALDYGWTSPRDPKAASSALALLLYRVGLRRTPPRAARDGVQQALAAEQARWARLARAGD